MVMKVGCLIPVSCRYKTLIARQILTLQPILMTCNRNLFPVHVNGDHDFAILGT